MGKRTFRNKKRSKLKNIISTHIENNLKEYIIVSILFLLGIIAGIIFINHISESQRVQINEYINSFINLLKDNHTINEAALLKNSITKNILLSILIWFMGSTVIGILIVYLTICFRGFCLGYTISSIITTFGTWKGLLFLFTTIFLQNIIFIPCILSLAVSGMKLYKSIMKDKRRENIKFEIYRHTMFSGIITIFLIVSSLVEVYVSKNLLLLFIKYI